MSLGFKKLCDYLLTGVTRVPKNSTLTAESGSTVNVAGTMDVTGTLEIGGTAVTASAAELNIMDGVTATAAEINRANDISARVVTTTASVLALTVTEHAERVVLVNSNTTFANTLTLPAATGSGAKFTIINNIAQTQGTVVVAAAGTNVMSGLAIVVSSTEEAAMAFLTSASSDKYSFNLTTTGGLGHDMVEAIDVATGTWKVYVTANGNGSLATGFSET